jgi:hypothetical protein
VNPDVELRELLLGHTVPRDAGILSVTLNGASVEDYWVRDNNRGREVLVDAPTTGVQTLEVETQ